MLLSRACLALSGDILSWRNCWYLHVEAEDAAEHPPVCRRAALQVGRYKGLVIKSQTFNSPMTTDYRILLGQQNCTAPPFPHPQIGIRVLMVPI